MNPTVEIEPRRRLHPLTPLLRGFRFVALMIAAISWQGYQDLGAQGWLLAVGGVMVLVLLGSVVSWYVTGYHVVGRELRVYEGLLSRRTRAIPLERLQSVELVRPLLARAFGLAELRLEVVGAAKTEAPLAFLTVDDANRLRQRLLAVAGGTTTVGVPSTLGQPAAVGLPGDVGMPTAVIDPAVPAPPPAQTTVHVVSNRDQWIAQLLRPHWLTLPLAIAAPIFYFAQQDDNNVSFIGVAGMITAVIGAIQAPVRALLSEWNFTIATATDGLHLRRGLTETRSQTVPPGRVQSATVQWPLLWRGLGWVRATMHVAGVQSREGAAAAGGPLLPVGTVPVAEYVVAHAVPGFRLTSVVVAPVPPRAAWLVPLRRLVLGYQLAETTFVTRDGLLTRRLVVVPYGRIQSVRIRQGPLQRLLGLASVWVDTAGGGPEAAALHRDVHEARALAIELAERSRWARSAASASVQGRVPS